MKFKAYDTPNGAFLAFFGVQFEEDDLQIVVSKSNGVYAILVFFDESSIEEIVNSCERYFGKINICFCGNNLEAVYDDLVKLKRSGRIRSIIIPPELVYSEVDLKEVEVGYEEWNEFGLPGGLKLLDTGTFKASDIIAVKPYIERAIDDLMKYNPSSELETILLLDIWFQRGIQFRAEVGELKHIVRFTGKTGRTIH